MADNKTSIIITAQDQASAVLKNISGGLGTLGNAASSLIPGLGALTGALTVSGALAFAKSTIDAADGLNDLSQRVGIGIKDLATWKLAAEQSGTSLESVAKGVKSLSVYMVEHSDKLRAVGVTATDANGAMIQLANVFRNMPDGVEKTALAVKLFGKAGMDMIPMLNQGSAGLSDAAEKSSEYGRRMAELAPHADKFNDQMSVLALNAQAAGISIADPLVKSLNALIETVNAAGNIKGNWLVNFLSISGDQAGNPSAAIDEINGRLATLRTSLKGISESWTGRNAGWFVADDVAILEEQIAYAEKQREMLVKIRGDNGGGQAAVRAIDNLLLGKPANVSGIIGPTGSTKKTGKTDLEKMLDKGQQNQLDDYYKYSSEESMGEAAIKNADLSAKATKKQADELEKLKEKYQGIADPLKKYKDELIEIESLRGIPGGLTAGEAESAIANVNKEMQEAADRMNGMKDIGKELGLTFTSAFEDAVVGGKKFSDVLKGLGEDILRIMMRKTVTEPLAGAIGKFDFGSLLSSFIPKFDVGTNYVPNDMLAYVHKGEAIVPAKYNTGSATTNNVSVVVNAESGQSSGSTTQAAELGRRIESAVRSVLLQEKRPGGLIGVA